MYETEIKIEITDSQRELLLSECHKRGFVDKGNVSQRDYYIKALESQHGGLNAFDIERYRSEGEVFFYTKKVWEMEAGSAIRREEEREATEGECEAAIALYPHAIKIIKDRHYFDASFEGRDISLSIDSVKFDHSSTTRYFMEPEILVAEKAEVSETREFLRQFAASLLNIEVSQIVEAPGMFAMAFKKL